MDYLYRVESEILSVEELYLLSVQNIEEILDYLKKEQKTHQNNYDFVHEDALLQRYEMAIEDLEKYYEKIK